NPIDLLIGHWRRSGVELKPGASIAQLRALEKFAGFPLPDDFKSYFAAANGMVEFAADSHHVSFWSIEQILSDGDAKMPFLNAGPLRLAFADVLINSWHFYLEYTDSSRLLLRSGLDDELKLDCFTRFADLYLRDPNALCI